MNDKEITQLKIIVHDGYTVFWNPFYTTCYQVKSIGPHAEEGDDEPCAIFTNGKYAALYNCSLTDFILARRLGD